MPELSTTAVLDESQREHDLTAIVLALVRELHPQRSRIMEVLPSSRIERDLGIDSLGRTELLLRLERNFRVRLPAETIGAAETVQDLLDALSRALPEKQRERLEMTPASPMPTIPAASEARLLTEVLDWHVARHADRLHLSVLEDEVRILGTYTYGELAIAAKEVAAGLIARDVSPGDRIALMLPTSVDFFAAFYGVLYAGAIPVPIYPPMRLAQLEEHFRRQAGILENSGAIVLITVPEGKRLATLLRSQATSLRVVHSVFDLRQPVVPRPGLPTIMDPDSVALIQYTSGSTGDPKGVVLSHANLLANIRAMGHVMEASSADVFVSWLPLYHDMGLIGAWLGCLHFGAPLYVMSPLSFLVRPESWLWAMHRFRATFSASPNFGFELCLNKIDDAQIEGLDLSSLRMVANGAEPVSPQTIQRFTDRFRRYGFRPEAMAPVYGLAENSVGLAFPPLGRAPVVDRVDRDALSWRGRALLAKLDDPHAAEFVSCGRPLPGHEVRVVDANGRELGERQEGQLEFRGPSSTKQYFRNEIKTRELMRDGWLDSGDRAYIADGEIFITGRIKDIIIRAGRHLYPQEIEQAVANIPGIRKGGVAVFGVGDPASGTERVVVLAETSEADAAAQAALQKLVHQMVTDFAGTPPDEVVLAPPRTVPKTSSGKIRRTAAKEIYELGDIGAKPRALWWQIVRLTLATIRPRLKRAARGSADYLYAAWWWTIIVSSGVLGWIVVMAIPRLAWRWAALRHICRAALWAMAVPLSVAGLERIRGNAVLVFNHSSYVDVLVLAAVVPGTPVFVAKKELARQVFAGPFLRRLGVAFVDRYDVGTSLVDADALVALARSGHTLVFFPEGTFTRRAGLADFYLGAFKVAAEADLPVVPGVLRGTRDVLRSDQWLPRRATISVEFAEPVKSSGVDFVSVLKLRDAVRSIALALCHEPDLGELLKPAESGS